MKNKFTQHLPAYFDGFKLETFEFDTQEELLNNELVKKYLSWKQEEPIHFCINKEHLMIQTESGEWWWVVGRIKYPELINLPEALMITSKKDLERKEQERIAYNKNLKLEKQKRFDKEERKNSKPAIISDIQESFPLNKIEFFIEDEKIGVLVDGTKLEFTWRTLPNTFSDKEKKLYFLTEMICVDTLIGMNNVIRDYITSTLNRLQHDSNYTQKFLR